MTDRQYAICAACGQTVYRYPGLRHGDGQVDSDDSPVWLLGDDGDVSSVSQLPRVQCGCANDATAPRESAIAQLTQPIGETIRIARRLAGLTQAQLAAACGTTQAAVAQWETGKRTPRPGTLQRVAQALQLANTG